MASSGVEHEQDEERELGTSKFESTPKPTLWVLGGPKFPEKLSTDGTSWVETRLSSHYQPISTSGPKGLWVHNQERIAKWYVDTNLVKDQTNVNPPRDFFAHALLNGKLYIMGGEKLTVCKKRKPIKECLVYQYQEKKWVNGPDLLRDTAGRGAVVYEGNIYLTPGGREEAVGKLHVFHPRLNAWEEVEGDMHTPRYGHAISACNKYIWVFGGQGENHQILGDVERYNFLDHTWQVMSPMGVPRTCLSVTAFQGKLYAIGGKKGKPGGNVDGQPEVELCGDVELYDLQVNSWKLGVGLCHPRAEHGSVVLPPEDVNLTTKT